MAEAYITDYTTLEPIACNGSIPVAGDIVRITLDQVAVPAFPETIDAIIQFPVQEVQNLVGDCVRTVYIYSFLYDTDDLEGAGVNIRPCDILSLECVTCCQILHERVDQEIEDRQDAVTAEAAARVAADTTLQNNINAEAAARIAADAAEVVARNAAILVETNARIAAVSNEATLRSNADTTLQSNINAEATTRGNADTTLTNNLAAHVANVTNPHSVTKAQVGLGNVDNTTDLGKPISTATQTALDNRAVVVTVPVAFGSAGSAGQVAMSSTFFYWYDGTRWQRVAKDATWV